MLIPLRLEGKRMMITLTIEALYPMTLGIALFDRLKPNTHYVKRKAPLVENDHRIIQLPLPVAPDQAMLELYNKDTGSDKGFRITGFDSMPLKEQSVWATPEQHRFMDFAIGFARKAGYVPPGFYHSKNYEFLIHYLPVISGEDGRELVTPARIHRHMPRVQLSQRLFKQFSIPVRVAILAHEGCHYFNNTRSEREADLCGIKYYLDAGFPAIEAVYAATQVFLKHPETVGAAHTKRARDIKVFIDQYKHNKNLQAV